MDIFDWESHVWYTSVSEAFIPSFFGATFNYDSMPTIPLKMKFILTTIMATKTIFLKIYWSILPTIFFPI
jgi:hypothetical protein